MDTFFTFAKNRVNWLKRASRTSCVFI